MVRVSAGKFMMGSPESEAGHRNDESPQHEVGVSSFYMGKYEVT
jgi:formylglycine-generating enzyme required for sulfatase activity